MSQEHHLPPVVLITGASTGLGLKLAQKLMHENYFLILTARENSLHRFAENGIQSQSVRLWLNARPRFGGCVSSGDRFSRGNRNR